MTAFQNMVIAHSGWHHHGGWWFPFWLLWIVLFAGAIWLVIRNVRARERSATEILAARYARGEVSSEEYRERLDELTRRQ